MIKLTKAINANGTSFLGYLPEGTKYEDLVRVFGEPDLTGSPDQKIKAEWIGKLAGLTFTIYDYKSKVTPEENTWWHIGGRSKEVVALVTYYFKDKRI
jgi:hypothetical protein